MAGSRDTLSRIDESLAGAQAAVAKLGTALFELDAERERHGPDLQALTGTSEAAWNRSGPQLSVLWAWYRALAGVVEHIGDRRKAPALHPADLSELWALLSTASVEVPADSRDLARDCLPEAETMPAKAPIAFMVRVISVAYQRVAETVTSILAIREMAIPRLSELERVLSKTTDEARSAGLRVPNEALAVKRQLDELLVRASRDPLSVDVDQIPSLAAAVERVTAELGKSTESLANVDEMFAVLEASLEVAEAETRDAKEAVDIASQKISGAAIGPDDVLVLETEASLLRRRLDEARHSGFTDRLNADRAGRALEPRIAALRTRAANLSNAAAKPIATRQELRGRLDAYRAKAHSVGRSEDAYLDRLYRAAREMLFTAPCDLAAAERRLAAYQAAVLASPEEDRYT